MTPNELEAYDAMIHDRDRWREQAKRLERLFPSGAVPCSASWILTNDALPPPMKHVFACVQCDISGSKEYAVLEHIPARHHLMQDDPDDQGESDDDGYNWWPSGWYSSLPESGAQTSYDDTRFPINEADFRVIAWMELPILGKAKDVITRQYTGHVPCPKCGRSHWMHGACLPNIHERPERESETSVHDECARSPLSLPNAEVCQPEGAKKL